MELLPHHAKVNSTYFIINHIILNHVLNNFRESLKPVLEKMGRGFAAIRPSPDFWTGLGLVFAILAAVAYGAGGFLDAAYTSGQQRHDTQAELLMHTPSYALLAGGALLLVSGFFDVVDGQVARVAQKTSQRGVYMDSVSDKIAESAIFVGIAIGGYAEPWLVVLAVALSLLVGYARAKSDALGIKMQGVGIGERAERLLVIAIIGMIGFVQIALVVVAIISAVTLIQRIASTSRQLSSQD